MWSFIFFVCLLPAWLCRHSFAAEHGTTFIHLGQQSSLGPGSAISEEIALRALNLILDPLQYPLLISCNLGRHHTGILQNHCSHGKGLLLAAFESCNVGILPVYLKNIGDMPEAKWLVCHFGLAEFAAVVERTVYRILWYRSCQSSWGQAKMAFSKLTCFSFSYSTFQHTCSIENIFIAQAEILSTTLSIFWYQPEASKNTTRLFANLRWLISQNLHLLRNQRPQKGKDAATCIFVHCFKTTIKCCRA